MLRNYFTIAWRNLQRNRINSLINIAGLAIGMSCVILIAIYVQDELGYDRFFKKAGSLFQVNMTGSDNGVLFNTGHTAPAVGPTMVKTFPEIESCARIYRPGDVLVRYEENAKKITYYTEKKVLGVDSNFLQLFDYSLLEGDPATCLQKPNSLVLTERAAKKYFGEQRAIGKVLLFESDKRPFVVTAVLKDLPTQSTFQFDFLAPISAYKEVKKRSWNWFWMQVTTYVKLRDHVAQDPAALAKLEAKFPPMAAAHAFQSKGDLEAFAKNGGRLDYHLMPFTAVHLYARGNSVVARLTTLGDIKYVYIFSVIAIFIIILACVNFMNLSTAQSVKRAKEVGIRKVLGSVKPQLIKQFLTEAILYSVIATVIALIIVLPLLKPFNDITGKSLVFSSIFSGYIWIFIIVLCLFMGLLAGIYPAFYLTSFSPVDVLKGVRNIKTSIASLLVRNGLVVFQFSISIALIICTAIVFRQLQYIQDKDMGLNKENVLVISNTDRLKNDEESFRQELLKQPGVVDASISSSIPSRGNFGDGYEPEQSQTDKPLIREIGLSSFMVDNDFVPTYHIKVLQGRNFSKEFSDSASVILNETAAKQIGWKEPVGKYLGYPGNNQMFKVIAVVKDFNIASLHETIEPFALFHNSSKTYTLGHSYISVRLQAGNTAKWLSGLENKWKGFVPDSPFDYSFLDSEFESLYRSEQSMGTVFAIFTFISIFVACLGLFGLSIYTLARRTKEIGVRKVLGATVQNIVALVSKDFLKLVLISAIIAFPIAWLAMSKWLEDFAYRITIGWAVFAFASITALLIAFFTISFQAIRAGRANPVTSLRSE